MTNLPEVRISFSRLLYETISIDTFEKSGKKIEPPEFYEEQAELYKKSWEKYSDRILAGMTESVGLNFYKDVIDASLTPGIVSLSTPMILSYRYDPDRFVDLLAHELIHVLLTDNDKISVINAPTNKLLLSWRELFGEHPHIALVHIPVHAILKHIYLDILEEPSRLKRDIEGCKEWPDYSKAWDYVEANDYKKILLDLKNMYRNIHAVE